MKPLNSEMNFILKLVAIFLILGILVGLGFYISLPTEKEIRGCIVTKMYEVNLCPGSKDYVPLKSISRFMQRAVVLTEDGQFFTHDGFDWEAIEKNAKLNMKKGGYKRGGSTITQQLAKNMFLSKEKTLWRKGVEALITYRLEKYLTKKEILERYLNVVEFGKDVYGIKEASSYYFKKHPSELGIVESAFLAMVLPSPVKYSSSYFKKELTPFAKKRIQRIVTDMWRSGLISEGDYQMALGEMNYFFGSPPPPLVEGEGEDWDPETIPDDLDERQQEALRKLEDPENLINELPLEPADSPTTEEESSEQ
ncbi:MAG: monofunctional biosynthetic peptidoglycan transglycosylase [Bdellovibrionota bacterium]